MDKHAEAMERYSQAEDEFGSIYNQIQEDINFLLNIDDAQWNDGRSYDKDKLKIVINKTESEADAIINEMRDTRPSIRFSPVDDKADVDTAQVMNGLSRNIEQVSDASSAYDTAAFPQVVGGLGFLRVSLDWIKGTFDQEPKIEAVEDFSSVLIDPLSRALDGSDMRYAFIVRDDMRKEDFEKEYPNAAPIDFQASDGWCGKDTVRVAEYFYKETKIEKLYLLKTGDIVTQSDLEAYKVSFTDATGFEWTDELIDRERDEEIDVIKHCILNGQEILEESEWVGEHIPVVPVYGKLVFNDGKRHISGIVKNLRDPQKLLNYWESSHTETIALQPNAPFVSYDEVIDGYEDVYRDANNANRSVLPAKAIVKDGFLLPPPQRQAPPQPSMAMVQQTQTALQHIKSVTGKVYDEGQKTLGAESGSAIAKKERKSDVASFHFVDNQSKAVRRVGIILGDLFPKVYSGARIVRILGEDGEESNIPVNQPLDGRPPIKVSEKFRGIFELDAGKYDVTVDVGPSFASQREEALNAQLELTRIAPQAMMSGLDLMIRNTNWQGKDELADRIKKTLPAGIVDDELSPEMLQLQKAEQAIEVFKQQIGNLETQLNDKKQAESLKFEIDKFNADIKAYEAATDRYEAEIKAAQARQDGADIGRMQAMLQDMQSQLLLMQEERDDAVMATQILLSEEQGEPQQPLQ